MDVYFNFVNTSSIYITNGLEVKNTTPANLDPTMMLPNKHFDTLLYTIMEL